MFSLVTTFLPVFSYHVIRARFNVIGGIFWAWKTAIGNFGGWRHPPIREEHHKKKTFIEAYKDVLNAFEVEFNERFIFKPI